MEAPTDAAPVVVALGLADDNFGVVEVLLGVVAAFEVVAELLGVVPALGELVSVDFVLGVVKVFWAIFILPVEIEESPKEKSTFETTTSIKSKITDSRAISRILAQSGKQI